MKTIDTINPIIGDASFVAAFGRSPTPADDPVLRVATHLRFVADRLNLTALDDYIAERRFPTSETKRGCLPTFVDAHTGARCAVAYLVEKTDPDLVAALDRDHHNDFIAQFVTDARFAAWAAHNGFTHDQLAIIQPGYPPPPPPDALYAVMAEDLVPTRDAKLDDIGLVGGRFHYSPQHVLGIFGGEAKLGLADRDFAYAAQLDLGGQFHQWPLTAAFDAGLRVDAYGPSIPRAWTIPVDIAQSFHGHDNVLRVHGGPRFTVAGERDTIGWNLGLEYRRKAIFHRSMYYDDDRFSPNDLIVGFDLDNFAGHTFLGITLGIGNKRGENWADH